MKQVIIVIGYQTISSPLCKEQVSSNVTFIDIDDEEVFPPLSPKANVSVEVTSDTDSTVPDIQVDDTT